MRKLAVEAEVLPSSLKIDEVTFISEHPFGQGGFSDVYQGKWRDKIVAVKQPRFYTSKNPDALKKVHFPK